MKKQKTSQKNSEDITSPSSLVLSFHFQSLYESPKKAEGKYLSGLKKGLFKEAYKKGNTKSAISSPVAHKILHDNDTGNYFSRGVEFKKKFIYQVDSLIQPTAKFLNESGKWQTNLERMEEGLAPFYTNDTGIVCGIELHHLTQRESKANEDPSKNPIIEMTEWNHKGKNWYFIIETNPLIQEVKIIASGLKKEDAINACKEGQKPVCNGLHFRMGPTQINRNGFDQWRANYWKWRAEKIKAGDFISIPPPYVSKIKLFERHVT